MVDLNSTPSGSFAATAATPAGRHVMMRRVVALVATLLLVLAPGEGLLGISLRCAALGAYSALYFHSVEAAGNDGKATPAPRQGSSIKRPTPDGDDGHASSIRCSVDGVPMVPDGRRHRFENANFRGVVKLNVRGGKDDLCSVALCGQLKELRGEKLWFGVEVVTAEQKQLSRTLKSLISALLAVVRRLMQCEIKHSLARPLIAFDATVAAQDFAITDGPIDDVALWCEGAPPRSTVRRRSLVAGELSLDEALGEEQYSRTLTLTWFTKFVDFERWRAVGLPRLLGSEMPLSKLWGKDPLQLVLFSEDANERTYYLKLLIEQQPPQVVALKRNPAHLTEVDAIVDEARALVCLATRDDAKPGGVSLLEGGAEVSCDRCASERKRLGALNEQGNDASARLVKSSRTIAELFAGDRSGRKDVACLISAWPCAWTVGRLSLEDDDLLFTAKQHGLFSTSRQTLLPSTVVDAPLPAAFAASSMGVFDLVTPCRVYRVIFASAAVADEWKRKLAPRAFLRRPKNVHEFLPLTRLLLNRRTTVPRSRIEDVAEAPGRALRLLLTAKNTEAFEACASLEFLNEDALRSLDVTEALVFALNLYHLIIVRKQDEEEDARPRGLLALADSLARASYVVAGQPVSAAELEHGCLRRLSAPPDTMLRSLLIAEKSCSLPLRSPPCLYAARVSLCLHAGILGCGPSLVPVYTKLNLERQMDQTASRVALVALRTSRNKEVVLPAVCRWFGSDFAPSGSNRDVALTVANFLPEKEAARVMNLIDEEKRPIKFAPFDTTPTTLLLLDDQAAAMPVNMI